MNKRKIILSEASSKKAAPLLVVMGLSGAGRSSLLDILEDLGYQTADNLPVRFLSVFLDAVSVTEVPLAVTVSLGRDLKESCEELLSALSLLRKQRELRLVFLESSDAIIQKRYVRTRRVHPRRVKGITLDKAIAVERDALCKLKKEADSVLDTSVLNPTELRGLVRKLFGFKTQRSFWVDVLSFSFERGLPPEANVVFDMRFLKNPYYQDSLQSMTGCHAEVQTYLKRQPLFQQFLTHLHSFLQTIVAPVAQEGRGVFTIAFGCSGGRHRSVATAEQCYDWLLQQGYEAWVQHRELDLKMPAEHKTP